MSAKGSARSPVTFHDVAVYFSEEEWEFLEDWRKELYKSVMCEIHGVLISMGYAIVNPDTLFRIKKEEKPFVSNIPACKKTESFQGHTSGSSFICPDILLRIKQEDNPVIYNPPPCKKRENIINPAPRTVDDNEQEVVLYSFPHANLTKLGASQRSPPCQWTCDTQVSRILIMNHHVITLVPVRILECFNYPSEIMLPEDHPAETSIISVHIKEEEDPYMSEPQHSDRSESFSSPTTSSPIVTSVFSLNNKPVESSYSRGRQDLGKGFLDIPPGKRSNYPALEKKARLRNMKFNLEELEILIGEVVWHYDKLFGSQSTKLPISDKYLIWEAILERINGVGRCSRNIEMLKKRWNDFKRKTREKIISNRASAGIPSQQQKLTALEKKVATILRPEQLDRLFQQPDRMEFLLLEPRDFDELSSGADTFRTKIGSLTSDSEIALSDSSSLHEEYISPTRTRSGLSKHERLSDLERKVATVLRSEQIELLESYSSSRSKGRPPAQHRLSDLEIPVATVMQPELMDLQEHIPCSRTREELPSQHNLSGFEVQEELALHPEKRKGLIEGDDTCWSSEVLSTQQKPSDLEKRASDFLIPEQEQLAGPLRTSAHVRRITSQEKQSMVETKTDTAKSPRQVNESFECLNTSQSGISTLAQQDFPIQCKQMAASHQLEHMAGSSILPPQRKKTSLHTEQEGSFDLQPELMEEVNVQPEQTDDYDSSESESGCEETSLKAEELDTPHKKTIDEVSESSSKECPNHHKKNKKEESMHKTFECCSEENKENQATAKEAPNNSGTKRKSEIRMKETLKNEHTILQQTTITPLNYQENLPRETSLPNSQFDLDNQNLSASIFPLVEKLDTFVDLQKKQYEALKGSVGQMNVYLHSQTRTLIKINTSIKRQTSAIAQLARAQQASATNIETLAANVLQTNTSLVEGNAALNKTLQGALDMLQVIIKDHFQQDGSTTKDGRISLSPVAEPTTPDIPSTVQPTAGLRRPLSGGRTLEEPNTRKRRKKRMRNTSVELIPL